MSIVPTLVRDEQRSSAIAFGSIAGHALVPNMGAYCATKSAVNTYMEVLHNELRHTNINIHLVCPPAVNAPLIDQTLSLGRASLTPIAMGSEQPMVPAPPEPNQLFSVW